jgi:hypothetical protein
MSIPVVPENNIQSLYNQAERSFSYDLSDHVLDKMHTGLLTMDIAVNNKGDGSYYASRYKVWEGELLRSCFAHHNKSGLFLVYLYYVLSIIGFFIAVPCVLMIFMEEQYRTTAIIISVISIVWIIVFKKLTTREKEKGSKNEKVSAEFEEEKSKFVDTNLFEKKDIVSFSECNTYCEKLCSILGLDPEDLKIQHEKVRGGGSTYVGFGAVGIGVGAALSIGSKLKAAGDNAKANDNLKEISAVLLYNNLAFYFNEHIEEIEKTFATV